MSGKYQDYPEILTVPQFAELFGISPALARDWFKVSKTPFGKVKEGIHYFKAGREAKIVKDRICEMAGILPKVNKDSCGCNKINNVGTIITEEPLDEYIKAALQFYLCLNEYIGLGG